MSGLCLVTCPVILSGCWLLLYRDATRNNNIVPSQPHGLFSVESRVAFPYRNHQIAALRPSRGPSHRPPVYKYTPSPPLDIL